MRIYLAGKFEAKYRLGVIRDELEALGHEVTSSCLDEPTEANFDLHKQPVAAASYARRDLDDLRRADLLILDTFDENTRGGREVEFGAALGLGSPFTWVVGPARNVFHRLAKRRYDSWEDALLVLGKAAC